jgi:hypothetical protein
MSKRRSVKYALFMSDFNETCILAVRVLSRRVLKLLPQF